MSPLKGPCFQRDQECKLMPEGHRALMQLNALNIAQQAFIRGMQTAPPQQGCSPSPPLPPVWCCLHTAGDGRWVTATGMLQGDTVDLWLEQERGDAVFPLRWQKAACGGHPVKVSYLGNCSSVKNTETGTFNLFFILTSGISHKCGYWDSISRAYSAFTISTVRTLRLRTNPQKCPTSFKVKMFFTKH